MHGDRTIALALGCLCACSSPDAAPASVAVSTGSPSAMTSSASSAEEPLESGPRAPASVAPIAASAHPPRCTDRTRSPSDGQRELLVDRGSTRERWLIGERSPLQGRLISESLDVAGNVVAALELRIEHKQAMRDAETSYRFDKQRRLVGVGRDGAEYLRLLAWDGQIPEGFQSLMDPAPFGFEPDIMEPLDLLLTELDAHHHEVTRLTAGASHVWSAFSHTGVEISFDAGRPILWCHSPVSRTTLCAYEWFDTRLAKVRCAVGNDTNPPEEGLPPGTERYTWTFRWEQDKLLGVSYDGAAGPYDVTVESDDRGRITALLSPEERLTLTRDSQGRIVRAETVTGKRRRATITRYECPVHLPTVPPLAPP